MLEPMTIDTSQSSVGFDPTPNAPAGTGPHARGPREPVGGHSIRGLFKRFGDKVAVNGLSLDIPIGSFYGLVGPNGAGKTTTLNMVTGLLVPDARHGHDPGP